MSKPPILRQNKTPVRYLDTTVNRLSSNPVSTGVFSTILSYMLPVVDASQAYKIFSWLFYKFILQMSTIFT